MFKNIFPETVQELYLSYMICLLQLQQNIHRPVLGAFSLSITRSGVEGDLLLVCFAVSLFSGSGMH